MLIRLLSEGCWEFLVDGTLHRIQNRRWMGKKRISQPDQARPSWASRAARDDELGQQRDQESSLRQNANYEDYQAQGRATHDTRQPCSHWNHALGEREDISQMMMMTETDGPASEGTKHGIHTARKSGVRNGIEQQPCWCYTIGLIKIGRLWLERELLPPRAAPCVGIRGV